MTRDLHHI